MVHCNNRNLQELVNKNALEECPRVSLNSRIKYLKRIILKPR